MKTKHKTIGLWASFSIFIYIISMFAPSTLVNAKDGDTKKEDCQIAWCYCTNNIWKWCVTGLDMFGKDIIIKKGQDAREECLARSVCTNFFCRAKLGKDTKCRMQ